MFHEASPATLERVLYLTFTALVIDTLELLSPCSLLQTLISRHLRPSYTQISYRQSKKSMAPWNKDAGSSDPQDKSKIAPEEDNPFIAFRRFADEQFNTLVHSLNALPGLISEARSKAEEEQKRWEQDLEKEDKIWDREISEFWKDAWGAGGDASKPLSMLKTSPEARDAARILLIQARNANVGIDPKRILSLYQDNSLSPLEQHSGGLAPFQAFRVDEPWLSVDWFKNSPYSPIQIEQHTHAHQQGSMWRAAFEDLLSAELNKEQKARDAWTGRVNNQRLYSSWAQTGMDWMLGLQCRGILPPQLPSLYQMHPWKTNNMDRVFSDIIQGSPNMWHARPVMHDFERLAQEIGTFDQDEIAEQLREPETEADLYEAFLGKADHATKKAAPVPTPAPASTVERPVKDASRQQPDFTSSRILSTLSTTEQTTAADGTVTTKVILKKRFADGSEQSTETVSTTHGRQPEAISSAFGQQSQEEESGTEKSKKGWFWS